MSRRNVAAVLCLLVFGGGAVLAQTTNYGSALTLQKPVPIADLVKHPEQFGEKKVMVEGEIVEVCQSMGCWIKISDASTSEPILFKVEDGVIEFPKDAKGKKVRAEGVLSVKTFSKEELLKQAEHEAQEQGKPFDAAGITGPKVVLRIDGEGAEIRD